MPNVAVDIRRALEVHLSSMSPLPRGGIQYENMLFTPPQDKPYLRTKLEFESPDGRTFGVGATTRMSGLFVVDCFATAGGGTADVDAIADNVLARFKSGKRLTFNSNVVTLLTPEKRSGVEGETWYFIPVVCPWTFRTTELAEA